MLHVYVNYPNSRIRLHGNGQCASIGQSNKPGQRWVQINPSTIVAELQRFRSGEYRFQSSAAANDMWLEVDFGDQDFERLVIDYLHRLLGTRYERLANADVDVHC